MINQVLQEIINSKEPVSMAALSHKLKIERGALEAMLSYWVRKGRLKDDAGEAQDSTPSCVCGTCGLNCAGAANCAFVARMPRMYTYSAGEQLPLVAKKEPASPPPRR